jgi:hypothetical protein
VVPVLLCRCRGQRHCLARGSSSELSNEQADLVFGHRYLDFALDGFGSIDGLNMGAICRFKVHFMMAVFRRRDVLVVG